MPKLRNRQKQIPQGFKFYQPETKWRSTPWASFETIVRELQAHRHAHPHLRDQHGWSTDFDGVANEVDIYNATVCQQMGWSAYITEGGANAALPKANRLPQKLKSVVGGVETLIEWISSGAEAVPVPLANGRAVICATCPENGKGDYTKWFTVPISEAIRRQISKRQQMQLATPSDSMLGVCQACLCPLKLKVHMPLDKILGKLPEEAKAALDPRCWILHEEAASK